MSIYRARLRNTSNALSPQVSSEQIRLQVSPKLFGVDSWIPQTIGQWIPDCWSGYRKSTGPKGAASNSWKLVLVFLSGFQESIASEIPRIFPTTPDDWCVWYLQHTDTYSGIRGSTIMRYIKPLCHCHWLAGLSKWTLRSARLYGRLESTM